MKAVKEPGSYFATKIVIHEVEEVSNFEVKVLKSNDFSPETAKQKIYLLKTILKKGEENDL